MVLVEARAGDVVGLGYTYADVSTALLIRETLADLVIGLDPMDIPFAWQSMVSHVRNLGRTGIAAMGVSAVDNALWDLKAKLLGVPLAALLGCVNRELPVYGSGGFTSYSEKQLVSQLESWLEHGINRVKIKVGREQERDMMRVSIARRTIGDSCELFVDANSAYDRKKALYFMEGFAKEFDVRWMEQPLPPEDLEGMSFLRKRSPARVDIADGEYGYDIPYFRTMIEAGAVDVVMADATRCCGISGFLKVGTLCESYRIPMSSHCAPTQHLHPGCSLYPMRHAEYFHDHIRIERMFFNDLPEPIDGVLRPDLFRPGIGVTFRRAEAERFRRRF